MPGASTAPQSAVRIGLVGADRFVNKMTQLARGWQQNLRVVPGSDETDAGPLRAALRIAGEVDVILFAGPLPYDEATADGRLGVPATFVPTGGPALHSVLVRALVRDAFDPSRASLDSMAVDAVTEAYAEVGLDSEHTHCKPYERGVSLRSYRDFHLELFRSGRTSGAITTIPRVLGELQEAGVPTLLMEPALLTLRQALHNAVLLGSGAQLDESRIVVMLAQLPPSALPPSSSPAQYWYQELRLGVHRELLREARRMNAIVLPHDQSGFLIISTLGSLREVTDDLRVAPFVAAVSDALTVDLHVGIGLGRSTVEAESNAYAAVARAADGEGTAYLLGQDDKAIALPRTASATSTTAAAEPSREISVLHGLVEQLSAGGDSLVVDAETVAQLTGSTLRTARRTLHTLVDAGLAWSLPPARTKRVGRPPMLYQLLDERLTTPRSADAR